MSPEGKPAWQPRVRFGGTDASSLVTDLTVNQSIEVLSSAELGLRAEPSFTEPIDLFSEVEIAHVRDDGSAEPIFTGNVIEAHQAGSVIRMQLMSGVVLTERNVPPMWGHRLTSSEVIYTTAREAGVPDEKLMIDGLDRDAVELVEVATPVLGVELNSRVRIGNVTFVPDWRGLAAINGVEVSEQLAEPFSESPVHAVVITRAALLRDAESTALGEIDVALGWLRVRSHYGLAWRPNGHVQRFGRARALAHPRRGEVVSVRALSSRRQWVRVPEDRTPPPPLSLDEEPLPAALPAALTVAERQALIACRRAASELDTVAAATALSDALEFYAAGVAADDLFEQKEIDQMVASLPDLAPHKKKVAVATLRRLNNSPLKRRVIEAAKRDSTPLTVDEVDLLWQVREARNYAAHGKRAKPPTNAEVALAISLVARLLAFRVERRLQD